MLRGKSSYSLIKSETFKTDLSQEFITFNTKMLPYPKIIQPGQDVVFTHLSVQKALPLGLASRCSSLLLERVPQGFGGRLRVLAS